MLAETPPCRRPTSRPDVASAPRNELGTLLAGPAATQGSPTSDKLAVNHVAHGHTRNTTRQRPRTTIHSFDLLALIGTKTNCAVLCCAASAGHGITVLCNQR